LLLFLCSFFFAPFSLLFLLASFSFLCASFSFSMASFSFSMCFLFLFYVQVWCVVCGVWCVVCGVWCVVCGVVWCGVVWCGVVWCGVVWCGVVWCGVVVGVVLHRAHVKFEGFSWIINSETRTWQNRDWANLDRDLQIAFYSFLQSTRSSPCGHEITNTAMLLLMCFFSPRERLPQPIPPLFFLSSPLFVTTPVSIKKTKNKKCSKLQKPSISPATHPGRVPLQSSSP
jgi:hypothetical protein